MARGYSSAVGGLSVVDYVGRSWLNDVVTGNELLRKLRRLARRRGVDFAFDSRPGKGGHGVIMFGQAVAMLRSSRQKEIPPGTLRAIWAQLQIEPSDL
jgi:mRNA interferase HicA